MPESRYKEAGQHDSVPLPQNRTAVTRSDEGRNENREQSQEQEQLLGAAHCLGFGIPNRRKSKTQILCVIIRWDTIQALCLAGTRALYMRAASRSPAEHRSQAA